MSVLSYLEKLLDGVDVEWLSLGSIAVIKTGQSVNKKMISDNSGKYPVINSGRAPLGFIDTWNTDDDPIGITTRGAGVGSITWQDGRYFRGNLNYSVTIKKDCSIKVRYMYHLLLQMQKDIQELCTFDGIPALNASNLKRLQIPIPCPDTPEKSLAIQSEIVRILDKFTALTAELTAELTARKKQYNYYRDQLLSFDEKNRGSHLEKLLDGAEVKWVPLGNSSYFEIANNGRKPVKSSLRTAGETPYYGANNIQDYVEGYTHDGEYVLIAEDGSASLEQYSIQYAKGKFWANNHVHVVRGNDLVDSRYLYHYLCIANFIPFLTGGTRAKLTKGQLVEISVPIPYPNNPEKSLAIQSEIVRVLDKFNTLTNSISEGLPREIELRQQQYEYYRDLLFSFPKPEIAQNTH
ncbi:restriction endonuclease subunit S [Klebsiella pneumoniae]|uniref:restriction endonuclease subunit S n=1 Tax=Klebsiella pneumoniae TaxID=573 RepID=UPI000E2FA137|nr:restriction endonuclease subunit S [Klebsiella pneumoniae]